MDGPMPPEYIEYVMCRHFYHCPPQDLPPISVQLRHLLMASVEAEVAKKK
jgi:hypothetical protein